MGVKHGLEMRKASCALEEATGSRRETCKEEPCTLCHAKYYQRGQIKKDENGGECSSQGCYKNYIQNFSRKT
jgi:hypothetical protein